MKTGPKGLEIIKRWAEIGRDDECWPYKGSNFVYSGCKRLKYGRVILNGKRWRVHRLVATLCGETLSADDVVCHSCDNTLCVNPRHLFVGTQADNVADKMAKGRHRVQRGESHCLATISDVQVAEVRALALSGEPQREIAKKFGISQPLVSMIKHGHTRSA